MTAREQDQADRAIEAIGRGRLRTYLLAAAVVVAAIWAGLSWVGSRLRGWL